MRTYWWEILDALGLETTEIDRLWIDLEATACRLMADHDISKDMVADALRCYADWVDPPEHLREKIERQKGKYLRDN